MDIKKKKNTLQFYMSRLSEALYEDYFVSIKLLPSYPDFLAKGIFALHRKRL